VIINLIKFITKIIVFLLLIVGGAVYACELDLSQVNAVRIEQKYPTDEQYQVFYVGTPFDNGDGRLFHSPKFVVMNKQDCQINHVFELPEGKTGIFNHSLLLNAKGGNIILSSSWSENKYDEKGRLIARGMMSQMSSYDYRAFELIQHRKFEQSVHQPQSRHLLSENGSDLYFTVSGAVSDPVYKMQLPELLLVNEVVFDEAYVSSVSLSNYNGKDFLLDSYSFYKNKNQWHDFEDQPLVRLLTKDENNKLIGINYSLEGEPVVTIIRENGTAKSASPSEWEKKYNVKIPPLPSNAISPNDPRQGVILASSTETINGKTIIKDNVDLKDSEYIKRNMVVRALST